MSRRKDLQAWLSQLLRGASSRGRRIAPTCRKLTCDVLEDRRMLAVVTWDGGGDGVNWTDPLNWIGNALPGTNDDVTIDVAGQPSLVLNGSASVRTLRTSEQLELFSFSQLEAQTILVSARSLRLNGGTIKSAAISTEGTGAYELFNGSLDAVAVNCNIDSIGSIAILNGLTLNGQWTLSQGGARIGFIGTQTLDGDGTIFINGVDAVIAPVQDTTLTIGPELTIRGGSDPTLPRSATIGNGVSGTAIVNFGTVSVVGGQRLTVFDTFKNYGVAEGRDGGILDVIQLSENSGTLRALSGGELYLASQATSGWRNNGNIVVDSGAVRFRGSFTTAGLGEFRRNGGSVFLEGILDNRDATFLFEEHGGSWNLDGGRIVGGTLVTTETATLLLRGGGFLDAVTLEGNLQIDTYQSVTIENGLTLNGTLRIAKDGFLAVYRSQGIVGHGTIQINADVNPVVPNVILGEPGTFTIGKDVTLRVTGGRLGTWRVADTQIVVNEGTIIAEGPGAEFVIDTALDGQVVNHGVIQALAGSHLTIRADVTLDGLGVLNNDSQSIVTIDGDLTGNTQANTLFQPQGLLDAGMNGSNRLEVMGRDYGNIGRGFQDNFAYKNLSIRGGADWQLQDASDNSLGSGTEALYVEFLTVGQSATLDLNGYKLYARNFQVYGQVIGGEITRIPDSGYLTVGVPALGQISVAGELDEWTFFARAGERISAQVNMSSLSAKGIPAAPGPLLDWGEVVLLSPDGIAVERRQSTSPSQILEFDDVELPGDGVYRLQVRAPVEQIGSIGNYYVSVHSIAEDLSGLLLNQPTLGALELPFSADVWTLALSAFDSIRLKVFNKSFSDVQFTLEQVGGFQLFTALADDSELYTVPADQGGLYKLRITSHTGQTGSYAFSLERPSVIELPLSIPVVAELVGDGALQMFHIATSSAAPLIITTDHPTVGDMTEIYVRRGVPPTRGNYDFRSDASDASSHTILVPNAAAGDWYVLVYGTLVRRLVDFTIAVDSRSVYLESVTPDSYGANNDAILTLRGAGFVPGTTMRLVNAVQQVYVAEQVNVESYGRLTTELNLSQVPPGKYSVVVQTAAGEGRLDDAFEVLPSGKAKLETSIITDGVLGRHTPSVIYVEYANVGSAAMPAPLIQLRSADFDGSDRLMLTTERKWYAQSYWLTYLDMPSGVDGAVSFLASGATPGVLNPGERLRFPIYYLGLLNPWNFDDTTVELGLSVIETNDAHRMNWAGMTYALVNPAGWCNARTGLCYKPPSRWGEAAWQGGVPPSPQELSQLLHIAPMDDISDIINEPGVLQLRPNNISVDAWSAIVANLKVSVGDTLGDWLSILDWNATSLARSGSNVVDVARLWGLEIASASAELGPIKELDSATDLAMPSTGVPLAFSRAFQSGIISRNTIGPFGRGWQLDWDFRLVDQQVTGALVVSDSTGSELRYELGNDGYISAAGDNSKIHRVENGLFELRKADGTITRFDESGRPKYVEDRNHNRTTLHFDALDRLQELTHSSGGSIAFTYNAANRISMASDSAGRSVTYGYDATNSYLMTVTTDDGWVTTYDYVRNGTPQTQHAMKSVARGGVTRTYVYDTFGRVDEVYLGNHVQTVDLSYLPGGQVNVSDNNGLTKLYYDERGQLLRLTDPHGSSTLTTFDGEFHPHTITFATGEAIKFEWCHCGTLASFSDELGYKSTFTYDPLFQQLTSMTDARGNTTNYRYDATGNQRATVYANQSVERFDNYNSEGLPQLYTNRRQQTIAYTYTPLGQVDRQTFADGSYSDFDYDARGNLQKTTEHSANGSDEVATYSYDYAKDGDRLRKVSYPNGRWVEYFYDAFGRRQRMTDSAGGESRYEYDAAGRLWKLRDATNSVIVEYLYTMAGQLQRINKGNGTFTTYEYDSSGQILHLVNHAPNGGINSRFDYTYDNRGRRTSMGTVDGIWTYEYDATGQLTHAVLASTNAAIPDQDMRYNYDAVGNRTATVINGKTTTYVANSLNEYSEVDGVAFRYDADGNLVFDGERNYRYDDQNRLLQASGADGVIEYEYNALGHRTATIRDGERTEYLLNPLGLVSELAEFGSNESVTWRNQYGLGLVAQTNGIGMANYFDFDALGSTSALTAANGTLSNQYEYAPFGEALLKSESQENKYRFIGKLGLSEGQDGLIFMRNRIYELNLGRFLTLDPIGLHGGDANFYRYVQNRPADVVDPSGLIRDMDLGVPPELGFSVEPSLSEYVEDAPPTASCGVLLGCSVSAGPSLGFGLGPGFLGPSMASAGCGISIGCTVGFSQGLFFGTREVYLPGLPGNTVPGLPPSAVTASTVVAASDPNDKVAPGAAGPMNYVKEAALIPYRVRFENIGPGSDDPLSSAPYDAAKWATAPAQRVTITDQLSTDLDWTTFRLGELGFGDTIVVIPDGQYFEGIVSVTRDGASFDVQLRAGIDLRTGRVFATFQTVDGQTGLPPNVLTGFLPPEDGTGRGKGYFSYVVRPKPGLPSGTEITNVALISFDGQPTIATNQTDPFDPTSAVTDPLDPDYGRRNARNTIDAAPPTSKIHPLPAQSAQRFVELTLDLADDIGGSGVAGVDIYAATDGGIPERMLMNQQGNSIVLSLNPGHDYALYSVATDLVGYVESAPLTPDAFIRIVPGDTNADGNIDLNDLNAVRNNFGATGVDIAGDADLDGDVDLNDLNSVRNFFGFRTVGSSEFQELKTNSLRGPAPTDADRSVQEFRVDRATDMIFGMLSVEPVPVLGQRLARQRRY